MSKKPLVVQTNERDSKGAWPGLEKPYVSVKEVVRRGPKEAER